MDQITTANPLVSVVITTYKRPIPILKRAVNSVLEQTYSNIELIIVNDCPEYAQEIEDSLSEYKNIMLINNDVNKGACYSRNKGLNESKGTYIAFLDDDDEWDKCKIQRQVETMSDDAVLVYCNGRAVSIDENGVTLVTEKFDYIKDGTFDPASMIISSNFIGGTSFPLINASILKKIGGFDESFPSSQDYELWIRLVQCGSIKYIDESLVTYHVMSDSITSNSKKRLKGYLMLVRKHKKFLKHDKRALSDYFLNLIWVAVHGREVLYMFAVLGYSSVCFPYNLRIIPFLLRICRRKITKKRQVEKFSTYI